MNKNSVLNKLSNKNSAVSAKNGTELSQQNEQQATFTIDKPQNSSFKNSPLNKAYNFVQQEKIETEEDTIEQLPNNDYEKYEEELNINEEMQARKEAREQKRHSIINKVITVSLILGCVYMIFLIYGAIKTQYIYADNGRVVAQRMTVEKIKDLNEFNKVVLEYRSARDLYEKILVLDYRIAAGEEDALLVAPEYEKLLETVEELLLEIQSAEIEAEYTQINTMLEEWIGTNVAVYCQRMSQAISQNNAEYANQAIEFKQKMYNSFSIITENVSKIGGEIEGADISDIKKWSPETFVQEYIGAIE